MGYLPSAVIELQLHFQRRTGALLGTPATAGPEFREFVRECNRGAILEIDSLKALEQGQPHGVGGHEFLDGGLQDLSYTCRRFGRKAFLEALRRDRSAEGSGGLGQLLIGGIGLIQPGKHEALDELGAGQLRLALHKAGDLCGLVGDGRQNGL